MFLPLICTDLKEKKSKKEAKKERKKTNWFLTISPRIRAILIGIFFLLFNLPNVVYIVFGQCFYFTCDTFELFCCDPRVRVCVCVYEQKKKNGATHLTTHYMKFHDKSSVIRFLALNASKYIEPSKRVARCRCCSYVFNLVAFLFHCQDVSVCLLLPYIVNLLYDTVQHPMRQKWINNSIRINYIHTYE